MCREDVDAQASFIAMCAKDVLFYINAFCWTYDPRREDHPHVPFVTWDFQDEAIAEVQDAIGHHDIVFRKSRDMGASWLILTTFEHQWRFRDGVSFLFVSRNEDYVDKPGNPKSLFWKLDYLHDYMPSWMLPRMRRSRLRMTNEENGSTIDGESTTGDVARGDRRTAILMDEFAAFEVADGYKALSSTRDATRCRVFNSTPQGTGNAFYDIAHSNGIRQIDLHWSRHPEKADGLYKTPDGQMRSPWYDNECKRVAHPQEIAQELDIDFAGSDYQFYGKALVDQLVKDHGRKPMWRGFVDGVFENHRSIRFLQNAKGPLSMWMTPDATGNVIRDRRYAMGIDVATGTGASNSVISVGDMSTKVKVAEFAISTMRPDELGRIACCLGYLFRSGDGRMAYMIWEANGPGRNFGDVVLSLGYREFYYRRRENTLTRIQSDTPGWFSSKDEKVSVHGELRRAYSSGEFVNPSIPALDELRSMIYTATGSIEHSRSQATVDPSGARANHGDRPTADALLWKALRNGETAIDHQVLEPPIGSMMHRRRVSQEKLEMMRQASEW